LRALFAFLTLPGVFAGLLPPIIAAIDLWRGESSALGYAVIFLGGLILTWCVRDFYVAGKGTLAPWDPPKNLVIVGCYRLVRNPMYIGVLLIVLGWALLTGSSAVFVYGLFLCVVFHIRVVVHEEHWLSREFPSQWCEYISQVPRWLPRVKPYSA